MGSGAMESPRAVSCCSGAGLLSYLAFLSKTRFGGDDLERRRLLACFRMFQPVSRTSWFLSIAIPSGQRFEAKRQRNS